MQFIVFAYKILIHIFFFVTKNFQCFLQQLLSIICSSLLRIYRNYFYVHIKQWIYWLSRLFISSNDSVLFSVEVVPHFLKKKKYLIFAGIVDEHYYKPIYHSTMIANIFYDFFHFIYNLNCMFWIFTVHM